MGNLFSGSKREKIKITPRDRAILDLKIQRDRLKQYQKKILVIIEKETEIAKKWLGDGNKSMALLCLKKKKYQEGLLDSTSNQLLNLEQLTNTIEFTQIEHQVVQGLKQGNVVLAELQKELDIQEVEKLMEDTAEAVAYQNEISAMLAGKFTEDDEEDLEKELAELQSEMAPEPLQEEEIPTTTTTQLPNVPSTEPTTTISVAGSNEASIVDTADNEKGQEKILLLEAE